MKSVLLLVAAGLAMGIAASHAVRPAPEPHPPAPRPKAVERAAPTAWVWAEERPRKSGPPLRTILSPIQVDHYVRQGVLKPDGPGIQEAEIDRFSRVGPRRVRLVRIPAPAAGGIE